MIVRENMTLEDGRTFVKTYSDAGYKIRKVGTDEVYGEAIDVPESGYVYEETDEKEEIEEIDEQ